MALCSGLEFVLLWTLKTGPGGVVLYKIHRSVGGFRKKIDFINASHLCCTATCNSGKDYKHQS